MEMVPGQMSFVNQIDLPRNVILDTLFRQNEKEKSADSRDRLLTAENVTYLDVWPGNLDGIDMDC